MHINLSASASPTDILASYYFARLLDIHLRKVEMTHYDIEEAIKDTEDQFCDEVSIEDFCHLLRLKGWNLDQIYLEKRRNRYEVKF